MEDVPTLFILGSMYRLAFLIFVAALLSACGDDSSGFGSNNISSDYPEDFAPSSNSNGQLGQSGNSNGNADGGQGSETDSLKLPIFDEPFIEDSTLISDVSQMPACDASNDGEAVMVAKENAVYFCKSGEWIEISDKAESVGVSCQNGNFVNEEMSTALPSIFGYDSTGTLVLRREGVTVFGVAEKGPLRYGASVKIVELDSVMRLADSDRFHKACIVSADGSYKFDSEDFVSPYIRVEASGYYHNELTGGLSPEWVTLSAVTDLTERDSVNVNILTHLEAPRTLKLVENTGNNSPIRAMKAQAFKDILYSFGFVIEGFNDTPVMPGFVSTAGQEKYSDDVRLFGDREFSAVLMALSVMMQRNGSGEAMVTYADGIAERIRGNGNWDDWAARADLADWLMVLDTSGTLEKIRRNVAGWGLGEVPDFEKYLRGFWTKEYGFPECNSSVADSVVHIGSSQSMFFGCNYQDTLKTKTRFICDAKLGRWRAATDIEKDTVGLGADTAKYDGAFRGGVINPNKTYVYEESENLWRAATSADVMEFSTIKDVYENLGANEKVVFVLRHAERTDDTGKNGHLTENGVSQAKSVGAQLAGAGAFGLGYSGYTRTKETCEGIASGNRQSNVDPALIDGLDGDFFIKDQNKYGNYKSGAGGSLGAITRYAYRDMYGDAFYDLEERSQEFVKTYILDRRASLQKVNFYISHDMMVLPFTVYASQKKVNLRYFDNRNWLNYLAGVAVIIDAVGKVRYVPVRGLESGSMII